MSVGVRMAAVAVIQAPNVQIRILPDGVPAAQSATQPAAENGPAPDIGLADWSLAQGGWSAGECVVCFCRPGGVRLEPCGHDDFCADCVQRFRTCPVCRQPFLRAPAAPSERANATPTSGLFSVTEKSCFAAFLFVVWLFLCIFGVVEVYTRLEVPCHRADLGTCGKSLSLPP